jgi:hypothetical protein
LIQTLEWLASPNQCGIGRDVFIPWASESNEQEINIPGIDRRSAGLSVGLPLLQVWLWVSTYESALEAHGIVFVGNIVSMRMIQELNDGRSVLVLEFLLRAPRELRFFFNQLLVHPTLRIFHYDYCVDQSINALGSVECPGGSQRYYISLEHSGCMGAFSILVAAWKRQNTVRQFEHPFICIVEPFGAR